jgi:O-antigen ligase
MIRSPLVGLILAAAFAGWAFFSKPDAPEATATAALVLLAAAGFGLGAVLNRVERPAPGLAVGIGAFGAVVSTVPASLAGGPLAPPLHYGNANGALLLSGVAGLLVAAVRVHFPWPAILTILAVIGVGMTFQIGARASTAAGLTLLVWAGVRRWVGPGVGMALGGLLVLLPSAATVLLAEGMFSAPWLVHALSGNRVELWHQAIQMANAHPVAGAGAGNFSQVSATHDPDLGWAHSTPLQTSAELGYVGLALLALLLTWGVLVLCRDAVLLGILFLPATVDYVLDFPWVVLAACVVLGGVWASSPSGRGNPWFTPPSP